MKSLITLLFSVSLVLIACGTPSTFNSAPLAEPKQSPAPQAPLATDSLKFVPSDPATVSCEGERQAGTVNWFNLEKGYGFISRNEDIDVFVHASEILGEGFRTLEEGQRVEFCVGMGPNGEQAIDVQVVGERTVPPGPAEMSCEDERQTGTVNWFNPEKGYGFISREGDSDVFVHVSDILSAGYPSLEEGQRVEFCLEMGPRGPQAVDLELLGR